MKAFVAHVIRCIALSVSLVFAAGPALAQESNPATPARAAVLLPDGVELATDVFLPAGPGPFPTLLFRTPYGTEHQAVVGQWFAAHGYAAVIQNVRGTGGSGGAFLPLIHERADGLATIEWIIDQPWSDDRVVLWGPSYSGNSAFLLAASGHPAVVAMAHLSGWGDNRTFLYRGGAFQLLAQLPWFVQYATGQSPPAEAWDGIFRTTPLAPFFGPLAGALPVLLAPFPYQNVRVPVLHLSGFHDYVYPSTLQAYEAIRDSSGGRVPQALVLGPWSHNQIWMDSTTAGDEDFGPASRWGFERVMGELQAWFDRHLGRSAEVAAGPPVRVFVMGENRWREQPSWPPADVAYEPWYLGEDGTLRRDPPGHDGSDAFVYDPSDPVPTIGGAVSHFFPHLLGVRDQRPVEARADVRVYTSEPLVEPMTLAGPIRAVIHASTDGPDTDFTAKLVEVRADGYARIIDEGIVRGRYRDGMDAPSPLEPGRVYAFEIEMGATALRIAVGSRIRLEVSSGNFPQYDRNPNTGVEPMEATEFRLARQTVHHGPSTPSHVILPVWRLEEGVR